MLNIEAIRQDFPMLQQKTMQQHPLIYLDNGATTLKPRAVIDAVVDYYENLSTNAHRGDYELSYQVDQKYEGARAAIAKFINADKAEVAFTSGASEALNMIAYGYGRKFLNNRDIVLTTHAEHASNVLPWMRTCEETGASLMYIPLDGEGKLTIENFLSVMDYQVKVIVIAQITNVLGFEAPIKEICKIAHDFGAVVVVDGAQSVPHMPIDVKDLDCDFLAFSAHKMCGPTGVGALYGKYELLKAMDTLLLGGGSNARFDMYGNIKMKNPPYKFESGTPPIEGVLGFHAAIQYLDNIGMEKIHQYEQELHAYAIAGLKELDNIILLNEHNTSGIITFNVRNVFAQDAATFFSTNGIAVRSGQHCAKLLNDQLNTSATLRASLYFYNSKEDVDVFLEVCKRATIETCLDVFF